MGVGKRVLIVDDDIDILESMAMVLDDEYEVTTSRNGKDALALLLSAKTSADDEPFDAVVLDLMMPVMDGWVFLREMRKHGMDTPVIVSSAVSNLVDVARELGVHDYLVKPFTITHFEEALARATG